MLIPLRTRFPLLPSSLALMAAVVIALVTMRVIWLAHWHGPFRDMWEIYGFLEKIIDHRWAWSDLWESYGYSHRLVIPKLLYIADYHWFDASNHLLIGVSLLCQLGIVAVFASVLRSEARLSTTASLGALALVVFFQFSGTLLFNFMHTFDVQWFLCCLLVVLALAVQVRYVREQRAHLLAALLIAAACLCNFSAMAAWPVWLAALLYGRPIASRRQLILCGAVFLFIGVYGWGARAAGLGVWGEQNPFYLFGYFLLWFPLMYLSSPLSDADYVAVGSWGALLTVLALLAIGTSLWQRRGKMDWTIAERFSLALATFCFGVALMTGIGRGYDPSHVHASRYQNIVVLFWSAVCVFIFIQWSIREAVKKYLIALPVLLAPAGFLFCQGKFWNENLLLGRNVARSHLALMMGYSADVPMIAATVSRSMIYVPGYNLERERALHERAHKGIYHGRLARHWLEGYPVRDDLPECQGIDYSLGLKVTPYTRFVEFRAEGQLENYEYALLVNSAGGVQAVAIREQALSVRELLLPGQPTVMRGIRRGEGSDSLQAILVARQSAISDCRVSVAVPSPPGESP